MKIRLFTIPFVLIGMCSVGGCQKVIKSGEDITFDEDGNLVKSSGATIQVWGTCDGDEKTRLVNLVKSFNEKYKEYNISDAWVLIVLNNNIAKELKGNKDLWKNKIPRILSFEELFNGVCKLNSYVSDLIHSKNYYKTWLGK